jgi:hypothetical protein
MGIDLYCNDKTFGTSYGHWGSIRISIIKSTIDYIQDKFEKDTELYKNIDEGEENWIGEGSAYYCYMKDLNELRDIIILTQKSKVTEFDMPFDNTVNNFISLCRHSKYMDALNYFEIGGLFALCNQSDCEGYYTPGNSLDICYLFDKIQEHMKKYDGYDCVYVEEGRAFNTIYSVFEQSYTTSKKVSIT